MNLAEMFSRETFLGTQDIVKYAKKLQEMGA
mgnify:CR=1 FL=1